MRISITLPGFSCMVAVARLATRALLPGNPRADDAELIVSELAINAIRHSTSRGGTFELTVDLAPGCLRIEVKDGGPFGYPPPQPVSSLPTPTPPLQPQSPLPLPVPVPPAVPPRSAPPSPLSPKPHTQPPSQVTNAPPLMHPWTTMHREDHARDRAAEAEEYAFGLAIVASASDKWGHSRYPDHAVWWAELAWPESASPSRDSLAAQSPPVPAPHPSGHPTIASSQ